MRVACEPARRRYATRVACESAMRAGSLTGLLCGGSLPAFGYAFERVAESDIDDLFASASALPTADVVEAPALAIVEVPGESTVFLFTRDGHAAHRAVVVRRIVQPASGPSIERLRPHGGERRVDVRLARPVPYGRRRDPACVGAGPSAIARCMNERRSQRLDRRTSPLASHVGLCRADAHD